MSDKEKTLRERMAEATAPAAPSMIPAPRPTPPPREKESVPDIKEAVWETVDRIKIARMVDAYQEANEAKRKAEKVADDIGDKLRELLGKYGVTKMICGPHRVSYSMGERSSISKDLLLSAGVQPGVIERATVTKPFTVLRISLDKDKAKSDPSSSLPE